MWFCIGFFVCCYSHAGNHNVHNNLAFEEHEYPQHRWDISEAFEDFKTVEQSVSATLSRRGVNLVDVVLHLQKDACVLFPYFAAQMGVCWFSGLLELMNVAHYWRPQGAPDEIAFLQLCILLDIADVVNGRAPSIIDHQNVCMPADLERLFSYYIDNKYLYQFCYTQDDAFDVMPFLFTLKQEKFLVHVPESLMLYPYEVGFLATFYCINERVFYNAYLRLNMNMRKDNFFKECVQKMLEVIEEGWDETSHQDTLAACYIFYEQNVLFHQSTLCGDMRQEIADAIVKSSGGLGLYEVMARQFAPEARDGCSLKSLVSSLVDRVMRKCDAIDGHLSQSVVVSEIKREWCCDGDESLPLVQRVALGVLDAIDGFDEVKRKFKKLFADNSQYWWLEPIFVQDHCVSLSNRCFLIPRTRVVLDSWSFYEKESFLSSMRKRLWHTNCHHIFAHEQALKRSWSALSDGMMDRVIAPRGNPLSRFFMQTQAGLHAIIAVKQEHIKEYSMDVIHAERKLRDVAEGVFEKMRKSHWGTCHERFEEFRAFLMGKLPEGTQDEQAFFLIWCYLDLWQSCRGVCPYVLRSLSCAYAREIKEFDKVFQIYLDNKNLYSFYCTDDGSYDFIEYLLALKEEKVLVALPNALLIGADRNFFKEFKDANQRVCKFGRMRLSMNALKKDLFKTFMQAVIDVVGEGWPDKGDEDIIGAFQWLHEQPLLCEGVPLKRHDYKEVILREATYVSDLDPIIGNMAVCFHPTCEHDVAVKQLIEDLVVRVLGKLDGDPLSKGVVVG